MYLQTICNVLSSLKTRKQENRRTCDDSQHGLLSLFKLQSNHEFEGKVIFLPRSLFSRHLMMFVPLG